MQKFLKKVKKALKPDDNDDDDEEEDLPLKKPLKKSTVSRKSGRHRAKTDTSKGYTSTRKKKSDGKNESKQKDVPSKKKIIIEEDETERKGKDEPAVFAKAPNASEEMQKWVDEVLDKGIQGIKLDFEKIKKVMPTEEEAMVFRSNNATGRNRYKDVPCLDKTRVLLTADKLNDYIHANFVDTAYVKKRFICMQSPLELTAHHFYQMVMQEEVHTIIICCNEAEEKDMAAYYPKSSKDRPITFGDITVSFKKTHPLKADKSVKVTLLNIKDKGGHKRLLKHYHWDTWPERGVPEISLAPINILRSVRGSKRPVIVHCLDGVSRSGTLIAIEYVLEKLMHGESCENMVETITELRNQRALCVHSIMQYAYVHRILLHYFENRKTLEMSQRLLEFIDDYDVLCRKYKQAEEKTPPFELSKKSAK